MFGIGIIKQDVEMSPEIKGRLTEDGKPIIGATIAHSIVYEGFKKRQELLQYDTTNGAGHFTFPEVAIKSHHPKGLLGQNSRVSMRVYFERNSDIHQLWYSSSSRMPLAKPVVAQLKNLDCDLNNSKIQYEFDTSVFSEEKALVVISICKLTNEWISQSFVIEE
ncbi:hypothetical protein F9L16_23390 [Agarivorans sp. B2Z047]|uniref:DUF6795 domain-containing protein n=1 Tax=Agarivorans sp. B2Z047 TaxID=2652721 RepID=UPI00128D0503|nr:DUF6795 domain-containing protein [Agarivorans sp. B2Z047]MPW31903.1 hypothetical protein [Agarivorans sp. B2Z047]UQN44875.1 hypothetical protein LQZ07_10545 [Agarivorans sp. B2Z047]